MSTAFPADDARDHSSAKRGLPLRRSLEKVRAKGGATRAVFEPDWKSADCSSTWADLEDDERRALRGYFAVLPTAGVARGEVRDYECRIPASRSTATHLDVTVEYAYMPKVRVLARFVVTCLTYQEVSVSAAT